MYKNDCIYWLKFDGRWTAGRWCEQYEFFDFIGSDEGISAGAVDEVGPEIVCPSNQVNGQKAKV